MQFIEKKNKVIISRNDIILFNKIKKHLIKKIKLQKLGEYRFLNDEALWMRIVIQLCVMGSAERINNLEKDKIKWRKFMRKIQLNSLISIGKTRRKNTSILSCLNIKLLVFI
jgi:hypothetical protein